MKKILIIGPRTKPIPSVEGGAVEQLVDYLLIENENNKFADIWVSSPFSLIAENESKKFKNTSFLYIKKMNSIISKMYEFISLLLNKFFSIIIGDFYIRNVCKNIRINNYDLIVVENKPIYGVIIRKFYKGKIILHLHNDFVNTSSKLSKIILNSYNKVITISKFLKQQVLNVDNIDVDVVYNGIDLSNYLSLQNNSSGIKKILYVGRINKVKGILELVRSFTKTNLDQTVLEIVGDYDDYSIKDKEFVNEFKKEVDNNKNIALKGNVPNSEIYKYYKDAYVGVIPTIVNEGLSLTAIEMLSSGLPVIYTSVGGLPEVISEKNGIAISKDNILNELPNALTKIVLDCNIRKQLASHTRENINKFDKQVYIKEMISSLLK